MKKLQQQDMQILSITNDSFTDNSDDRMGLGLGLGLGMGMGLGMGINLGIV